MMRRTKPEPVRLTGLWTIPDGPAARRMAAYDQLPPAVRRAVDNSICDFNVHTILDRLKSQGEGYVLALIRRSEDEARRNWEAQRGRVLDRSRRSFGFP
jgi:hypothetical protein